MSERSERGERSERSELIDGVSPMCRRADHHDCLWFSYSDEVSDREYWCACECHGTATLAEIDLTDDTGGGAEVEVPDLVDVVIGPV
jgi:hypothetical protein